MADKISLQREPPPHYKESLQLPCGKCPDCNTAHAKAWSLRCKYELQEHARAVFLTLTYNDENLPITLQKRHLQLYLKRLRAATNRALRYFATGEYGTHTNRQHYHAILYGMAPEEEPILQEQWNSGRPRHTILGNVHVDPANERSISYVAGYCDKKKGWQHKSHLRVDPTTGEEYRWQAPFILMSRNPGIGANAKQHINSWRLYAINNGSKQPVPRYYHNAWKAQATERELNQLREEKAQYITRYNSIDLNALEQITIAQQTLQQHKRNI